MATPLLNQHVPAPGEVFGCPQLLVGPGVGRKSGAPALLANLDDRRTGRGRLALFVDLPPQAGGPLRAAGSPCPPVWPLLLPCGGGQVMWDGLTSVAGAVAVRVGTEIVSWVADPVGHQVCVTAARRPGTPDRLLAALLATGLVDGWASREQHERRWLVDNVARVTPGICPPVEADVRELRAGLAVLAGFADPAAMVATGGYLPAPEVSVGALTLARVRTTWRPELLLSGRASVRVGPHQHGPGSLLSVLDAGRLTSLRVARLSGGDQHSWSAHTDVHTGMSHVLELEVDPAQVTLMPPPALIWDHPDRLLDRLDAAALGTPAPALHSPTAPPRMTPLDPTGRVLDGDVSFPSLLLETSIDLYGRYGPDRILVRDAHERADIVADLRRAGIEALQSRWVDDAVQIHPALVHTGVR